MAALAKGFSPRQHSSKLRVAGTSTSGMRPQAGVRVRWAQGTGRSQATAAASTLSLENSRTQDLTGSSKLKDPRVWTPLGPRPGLWPSQTSDLALALISITSYPRPHHHIICPKQELTSGQEPTAPGHVCTHPSAGPRQSCSSSTSIPGLEGHPGLLPSAGTPEHQGYLVVRCMSSPLRPGAMFSSGSES